MDIVNHSAELIMSYHMLHAVVRVMITPPDEGALTNTNTNTISGVLCTVYFRYITLMFCGEIVPTQLCPKMMRNLNTLLCYYTWTLYYIRTSNCMDFLDYNLQ